MHLGMSLPFPTDALPQTVENAATSMLLCTLLSSASFLLTPKDSYSASTREWRSRLAVFECINDFRTALTIIASWQKLPEFLLSTKYFQETKLFAETKHWHAKYCLVISDICFQSLHADRKFWSHRYFFLLLCTYISGNTGYLDGEIFLPYKKKKNLSKSRSQWKDQLNRCIEVCRSQFRKLLN